MAWQAHRVVFRLQAPMHIGCGKVGNLQRTRSYVIGRVIWGALTLRLTRDAAQGKKPATDSREYQIVGERVHRHLAYTYFYPATHAENEYRIAWPWEDESGFRRRFLSSYCGTALQYPSQSAAEGMLHEVEFISPRTLDSAEPVFLVGYVFESDECPLAWVEACTRLQLGGERGYGWGTVEQIEILKPESHTLFDGKAMFDGEGTLPVLSLPASESSPIPLLAHTRPANLVATGETEPLVGREWRSHHTNHRHAGQHVTHNGVCFAPGSLVNRPQRFEVGAMGIWQCEEQPGAR